MTPTLMGLPPDMEQTVAVSDAKNQPRASVGLLLGRSRGRAEDEGAAREDRADGAGSDTAPRGLRPRSEQRTTTATRAGVHRAAATEPAPLADEQFRVFELAYGSGATLVLTAHTDGPQETAEVCDTDCAARSLWQPAGALQERDRRAHLDDTPRMRLVDAVDALADNRGELLFELRGDTQRQFALYRVLRGTAKELFVTGGGRLSERRPMNQRVQLCMHRYRWQRNDFG